jgi:DNA end-binding protein Ku
MSRARKPAAAAAKRKTAAAAVLPERESPAGRIIWKGSVGFGLVHVPVALYTAERREDLKLTMVDRRDAAPIGYQRINKTTGAEVAWDDVVKGYEYEDGRYVLLGEEDFRAANRKASRSADIFAFVNLDEIPPLYFDRPYYLEPIQQGDKVYALLRETLRDSGRAGLAKVVLHNRQHLAALLCQGPMLVLNLLRFENELRDPSHFQVPDEDTEALGITRKERDMAQRLVEDMVEKWQPRDYHDEYRDDLLALVQRKIAAGETARIAPEQEADEPESADVIDLMSLLKRSVRDRGKTLRSSGGRRAQTAPRRRKRA